MKRKIQNIAPLLANHFMEIEIDTITYDKYHKLVVENAQRIGNYYNYLGRLHDSWFIETKITLNKFSLTLNDFTTHVFSDVIVDKKKLHIDHEKLVFPIQLDFESANVTFNTVDEKGNIQRIETTVINEYLYEQVISIDERDMEIGLVVWKDGIEDEPGQHILILMNVTNITLTELQDKAWKGIFGNAYDEYYGYFKTQLTTGRYLSDQPNCYELYNEYEGQN